MLKTLIAAIVTFVAGVLASDFYHNRQTRKLINSHREEMSKQWHAAFSSGWDEGHHRARMTYAPQSFLDEPSYKDKD